MRSHGKEEKKPMVQTMRGLFARNAKPLYLPIFLIVLFILADILFENYLGIVYSEQLKKTELILFLAFVIMQILFAPIQSGLSDLYGRKKSLLISLTLSLGALGGIYMFNQNLYLPILAGATI